MNRLPGFVARDHVVTVPLDHADPGGATIEVFARELVAPDRIDTADDLPCLLFLQGGPGGKATRPQGRSSWVDVALRTHRVILLDQRGRGAAPRSPPRSPATAPTSRSPTTSRCSAPTRSWPTPRSCAGT